MRCSVYFLLCFTYILLFVREVHSQITFVQPPPASSSHDYHQTQLINMVPPFQYTGRERSQYIGRETTPISLKVCSSKSGETQLTRNRWRLDIFLVEQNSIVMQSQVTDYMYRHREIPHLGQYSCGPHRYEGVAIFSIRRGAALFRLC
jgi:hypothetical protein